ncbi:hypothetical protein QM012_002969 [Aureobasidium pullulans]|uniref:Uncharacterized protein n=1 Tax=Aureobasidium pullulans TaxID=5580 RepID=A0ABR0T8W9_AURPU
MYTTVPSWIEEKHKLVEKWGRDPTDKEENHLVITALESLLNNGVSGSETAMKTNTIYFPRLISGLRAGVGFIWASVADASRRFGASHTQQLVDLVVATKQLPDVTNEIGYVVTYREQVIWREMPDFGWIFYEHGLDLDLDTEGSTNAEWHAQAPGHLNAHTFAASLFDNILQPFDENRELADEWKMYIPPAAVWIMISGQVVHDLCFKGRTARENQAELRDDASPEIWMQVKKRFATLSEQTDIDDHCQGLAKEAAQEMERIERNT